ncbi:MAG: N-acetyltransferase family protein [Sandaracinaceae bacterium]
MIDPFRFTMRDGRIADVRTASVVDARRIIALDRILAEDGRGMVLTPEQVRTVDEERSRIDAIYRRMAAGDATVFIVADVDGVEPMAGSAQLDQLRPARCAHVGVLSIGVLPDLQRQGIGRALMEALIQRAREHRMERLELYVRADNPGAQALYRGVGFAEEARRARFVKLEDGSYVDDVIMSMSL